MYFRQLEWEVAPLPGFKPVDDIKLSDFSLGKQWTTVIYMTPFSKYQTDDQSDRIYKLVSDFDLRKNHLYLLATTMIPYLFTSAIRVFNMATCYYFCSAEYKKTDRLIVMLSKDLLRLAATPLQVLCLTVTALFGLIFPKEGRKIYASLERLADLKFGLNVSTEFKIRLIHPRWCYPEGAIVPKHVGFLYAHGRYMDDRRYVQPNFQPAQNETMNYNAITDKIKTL